MDKIDFMGYLLSSLETRRSSRREEITKEEHSFSFVISVLKTLIAASL